MNLLQTLKIITIILNANPEDAENPKLGENAEF